MMQICFEAASLYTIVRTAAPGQRGQRHAARAAAVGFCVYARVVSVHQALASKRQHLVLPWLGPTAVMESNARHTGTSMPCNSPYFALLALPLLCRPGHAGTALQESWDVIPGAEVLVLCPVARLIGSDCDLASGVPVRGGCARAYALQVHWSATSVLSSRLLCDLFRVAWLQQWRRLLAAASPKQPGHVIAALRHHKRGAARNAGQKNFGCNVTLLTETRTKTHAIFTSSGLCQCSWPTAALTHFCNRNGPSSHWYG